MSAALAAFVLIALLCFLFLGSLFFMCNVYFLLLDRGDR